MNYGRCYSSTGSRCSGKAQPGVLALRNAVLALYPIFGDLGIYNCRPVRGGGKLSTHGEGRGWDCRCNANDTAQRAAGDRLAALLVQLASFLGIQRIIWNRRQWDVLSGAWRSYGGVSPHTDHLHIELCWEAAAGPNALTLSYVTGILTGEQEDELTPEEKQQLEDSYNALFVWRAPAPGQPLKRYEHLNIIENMLKALASKAGLEFDVDGTLK